MDKKILEETFTTRIVDIHRCQDHHGASERNFSQAKYKETKVSNHLETIYSIESESFNILDKKDISFTLRPRQSCEDVKLVVMALSAPKNTEKREMLRGSLSSRPGLRLIFLLGQTSPALQAELQAENIAHGDLD